jgi:hypothetical protein
MATDQWHKIIDTADRFALAVLAVAAARRAVIKLDGDGYEAGEYDS